MGNLEENFIESREINSYRIKYGGAEYVIGDFGEEIDNINWDRMGCLDLDRVSFSISKFGGKGFKNGVSLSRGDFYEGDYDLIAYLLASGRLEKYRVS
jgi:hypothetical protein